MRLFVVYLLGLMALLPSKPFCDPGAFWHVRVGERVLEHGFFNGDPYTFTFPDEFWIPQQWLAECGMALVHKLAGFDAILLAMCVLLAGFYTWITRRMMEGGLRWPMAMGLTCLGMFVSSFHFFARPHLLTLVLLGWYFATLVDYEAERVTLRRILWLIPLTALWANLHGGVLAGIMTMGMAWLGWCVFRVISTRTAVIMLFIGIGCGLMILVNPYGLDLPRTWWRIMGSRVIKEQVSEHLPINLRRTPDQAVTIYFVIYVALLLTTWGTRPRVVWFIPIVWYGLTVQSIRQGPLFCTVALFAIADFLPYSGLLRFLRRSGDTLARKPEEPPLPAISWRSWIAPCALVTFILGLQMSHIRLPIVGSGCAKLDPEMQPIELVKPLREYAKSHPVGTPIFNDSNWGGFLIYFAPELRIYTDDRFELYGDPFLLDYLDLVEKHPERIEALADKYGFDCAFIRIASNLKMDGYLKSSPRWREVARTSTAVMYLRNGS